MEEVRLKIEDLIHLKGLVKLEVLTDEDALETLEQNELYQKLSYLIEQYKTYASLSLSATKYAAYKAAMRDFEVASEELLRCKIEMHGLQITNPRNNES